MFSSENDKITKIRAKRSGTYFLKQCFFLKKFFWGRARETVLGSGRAAPDDTDERILVRVKHGSDTNVYDAPRTSPSPFYPLRRASLKL